VSEEEYECRDADQQVDDRLYRRPRAEEKIHDVPVAAHVCPECDETPVEAADDYEDERNLV